MKNILIKIPNYNKKDDFEYDLGLILNLKPKLSSNDLSFIIDSYEYDIPELYNRFFEYQNIPSNVRKGKSLRVLQLRFGDKIGYEKYNEFKKNSGRANNLDYLIQKYGKDEGTKKYNKAKIKRSHSLEGYVLRYGETTGRELYEKYWKNTNFSTSEKTYVKKYGDIEGKAKYNEFKKTISYKNSYNRYKDENNISKKIEIEKNKKKTKEKNGTVGGGDLSSQGFL